MKPDYTYTDADRRVLQMFETADRARVFVMKQQAKALLKYWTCIGLVVAGTCLAAVLVGYGLSMVIR